MTVFTKRAVEVFAPTTSGGAPRGPDMGQAQLWGTEVESATATGGQQFTPLQFEAAGDGIADDGAELNAMTEAARETLEDPTFIGNMDLANHRYRSTISIDLTGMRFGYGKYISNGVILSEAEDKAALDFTYSFGLPVYKVVVQGSESARPIVGALWARPAAGTPSAEHSVRDSVFAGWYGLAAGLNYASESFVADRCVFENENRDAGAYALMFAGHSADLTGVQSDFEPIASGERSNLFISTRQVRASRSAPAPFNITNITNANPPVCTFTGTAPANGDQILFRPTSGMESLADVVLTVGSVGVDGADKFRLVGANTTSDGAFGGGQEFWRTGTPIYISACGAHYHENLYGQAWGGSGAHIVHSGEPGVQIRALHMKAHFEGSAISSLLHFKHGAQEFEINDLQFQEHNNQCVGSILSTDGSGIGFVKFVNSSISILGLNETPVDGIFDEPVFYQFNGKSSLRVPSGLLTDNSPGQLRRLPDEIVVEDAAWPARRYNFNPSPAHVQQLDNCNRLFATVTSGAVAYNHGWLDRVGSLGGTITAADGAGAVNPNTYVALATGTTTDMSDSGFKRRGARIFRPDSGDMMFEFVFSISNAQLAWAIGFEAASSIGALADADEIATLDASDVVTVTANNAFGIMHDPTGTTDVIYFFNRNAGGLPSRVSTGVTLAAATKMWWRIHGGANGIGFAFYSTDGIDFTRVARVTNAFATAENYAPAIAGRIRGGATSRELRLYAANAICLRV